MALMNLRGAVPNSGAHRMAWVIGLAADPAAKIRELEIAMGVNMPERLLAGDVLPASPYAGAIWAWSEGKITIRDFYLPTPKRWGDVPHGFRAPRPPLTRKAA